LEKEAQRLTGEMNTLKQETEKKKKELESEIVLLKENIEDLESDKNNISASKESVL